MTRRTRQRVTLTDGTERVQTKRPRADVLWYPASGWTTVLVRRTHDVALARALAEQRWAEITDLTRGQPLAPDRQRVGWWTTTATRSTPEPGAAVDQLGRAVTPCAEHTIGAGPGVEFRPEENPT